MSRPLFSDFLDNEETFSRCSDYWHELMTALARQFPTVDWHRGFAIEESHAPSPLLPLESRAVYESYSKFLRRAVQIYQFPPTGQNDDVIGAALKDIPAEDESNPPDSVLLINLTLTEATAEIAKDLLSAWVDPSTTVATMNIKLRPYSSS